MTDWQVASGKRNAVFISSTSIDLGKYREIAKNVLIQSGYYPVVQEHFGPDSRTIENMIFDKVQACDAVICLIGHAFGRSPKKQEENIRSYTQIEYDTAKLLNKPMYIFLVSDDLEISLNIEEKKSDQLCQRKFREEIKNGDLKYDFFTSREDLESKIYAVIAPILKYSSKKTITYVHPPVKPAFFVGRNEELNQLKEAIFKPDPGVIVILGMGGQGKSTLLAHGIKKIEYYPFQYGIWISANRGGFTFSHFLDKALEVFLGHKFNKLNFPQWEERLALLIGYLQETPSLIVLDGIESWLHGWTGISDPGSDIVFDTISRSAIYDGFDTFLLESNSLDNGSHVIITTRALPSSLDHVDCALLPVLPDREKVVGLQGLSPEDAVNLLKSMGLVAPLEKLNDIAARFVYHPLAITGFASVAKKLGSKWEEILLPHSSLNSNQAFFYLLDETRKHLPNNIKSIQLIKLISLSLENPPIGLLIWLWQFDELSKDEGDAWLIQQVIMLSEWNIFSWDSESYTMSLHPLVMEYFSNLWAEKERQVIHARIATWYRSFGIMQDDLSIEAAKNQILAINHYLLANDVQSALLIMFGDKAGNIGLFTWLKSYGHLWECSELLLEITHHCHDELKGQCILARASVLNELDLLQIAKEEIDEAISLFEKKIADNNPQNTINLARIYGTKGTLYLASNKTNVAIDLFNISIKLFDETHDGVEKSIELSKTLSNRGLGYLGTEELISAEKDFSSAIELLDEISETSDELSITKLEILIHRGVIPLFKDDAAKVISNLNPVVEELAKYQSKGSKKVNKLYFLSLTYLGLANNMTFKPQKAIDILSEVIERLSMLETDGIRNIWGILALASNIRGQSQFLLGNYEKSLEDLNVAVSMYINQIKIGSSQFEGQLSNTLFNRAKLFFFLEREDKCRDDLNEALIMSHKWIRDWIEDCNISNVYLENAIETLSYLPVSFHKEATEMLNGIFLICDNLVQDQERLLYQKAIKGIRFYNKFILNKASQVHVKLPASFLSLTDPHGN